MDNIKRVAQKKQGRAWVDTYTDNIPSSVYESLAHDLVAKKINNAPYIKNIRRTQHYTHSEIIVTYDNNVRSVYTLPSSW